MDAELHFPLDDDVAELLEYPEDWLPDVGICTSEEEASTESNEVLPELEPPNSSMLPLLVMEDAEDWSLPATLAESSWLADDPEREAEDPEEPAHGAVPLESPESSLDEPLETIEVNDDDAADDDPWLEPLLSSRDIEVESIVADDELPEEEIKDELEEEEEFPDCALSVLDGLDEGDAEVVGVCDGNEDMDSVEVGVPLGEVDGAEEGVDVALEDDVGVGVEVTDGDCD